MVMMDAWMREAEDAMTALVDIEARSTTTDRKLLELWVKLDQLEALLLNPPSKPVLTEADLESRRELLLDIRIRTRAVATSLFALPPSKRSDCSDSGDAEAAAKSDGYRHVDIPGMISSSKDDQELMVPLITNDATQSPSKKRGSPSLVEMTCLSKAWWSLCTVLGGFVIVLILFALSTVL